MRLTQRTLGNGLSTTHNYRADSLTESITVASGAAGVEDLSFDYSYDANKNPLTESRGTPGSAADDYSFSRTVDTKDRLTNWLRDNGDTQAWTLSLEGDWDQTDGSIGGVPFDQSRTHNAPHEILTIDPDNAGPAAPVTINHDAKGNLTQDNTGLALTYDFDNMLSQAIVSPTATRGTPGTHTYEYDALGRRISKTADGVTTVFVRSGQQILAEYEDTTTLNNASPTKKYIYCSTCYIDEPVAMITTQAASGGTSAGGGEETYYYHRDRNYNVIGLTDTSGGIVELYTYTPHGERQIHNATWATIAISAYANHRGFQGLYHDNETNLIHNRARTLNPQTGRFNQRDPLGYPDGLNTYAAYHVMWGKTDPSGQAVPIVIGGVIVSVGAVEAAAAAAGLSVAACLATPSCREAALDAAGETVQAIRQSADDALQKAKDIIDKITSWCGKWRCKIEVHGPHHSWMMPKVTKKFPFVKVRKCWKSHISITCWQKGASNTRRIQIPFGPCYKNKHGQGGGVTH